MIKKILGMMVVLLAMQSTSATPLFNGRNFDGWQLATTPATTVDQVFSMLPQGVVAATGQPGGFLATTKSYANYSLHVEWRWSGKPGNGGVLLHISDGPMDRVWPFSLQVQTKHGNAGDLLPMAGATFAEPLTSAPGAEPRIKGKLAADSELAVGQWNVADIVARDGMVEVSINGVLQNRVTGARPAAGRIGFQLEGAPYELRNVQLTELPELPPAPAVAPAPAQAQTQAQAQAQTTDPRNAKVTLPDPANPKLPSLIMIGDSTVRNGQDDGQGKGAAGQWGWGNPIAAYFDPTRINVVNRAVGGLSSRTYLSSGHWQRTLPLIKAGDVVLIQFGHNDSGPVNDTVRARGTIKGTGEESEAINNLITRQDEVVHSYGWYLRNYVAQIKARGATPVICSPIPRNQRDQNHQRDNSGSADGKMVRAADSYAGWAKQVAAQEKVGFIDLNDSIAHQYDAMGRDKVDQLFPPAERTHTNLAGAQFNARVVVAGLKALRLPLVTEALSDAGRAITPAAAAAAEDDRPVIDSAKVGGVQPRDPALTNLFLVGDSTVKSGGAGGAIGWGERIATHFDTNQINVVNHAIGGRSSRTFLTEGRWNKVLEQIKPGDFVAIQFGHNDGGRIGDPANKNRASLPGIGPETVEDIRPDGTREPVHSFGWYMARYVADAKARGATVILLSPVPHRDAWENARDFASFAEWDQQVARQGGALYADLTMVVSDAYRKQGAPVVDTYFSDARTHTNEAGARFNAARVVEALQGLPGKPLAAFIKQ